MELRPEGSKGTNHGKIMEKNIPGKGTAAAKALRPGVGKLRPLVYLRIIYGCFRITLAELRSCHRDLWPVKCKILSV